VSTVIPKATKVAWALKGKELQRDVPSMTRQRFLYNLSKASYEKEWGKNYLRPSPWERFLAFVIRIIPKVGPLKALSFHTPTPETEKLFMASFDAALSEYRRLLADVGGSRLSLPNRNFDTGGPIRPGTYFLQDDAYGRLLNILSEDRFQRVSPELRSDLLN